MRLQVAFDLFAVVGGPDYAAACAVLADLLAAGPRRPDAAVAARLERLLQGAGEDGPAGAAHRIALLTAAASVLWLPHAWREFPPKEQAALDALVKAVGGVHLPSGVARLLNRLARNGLAGALHLTRGARAEDLPRLCAAVHVAILAASHVGTQHPLAILYADPGAAAATFLPAAPADEETEVFNAFVAREGGLMGYRCDCGFRYFIADCGNPAEVGRCPQCGNAIGGLGHALQPRNVRLGVARMRPDVAHPGYTFAPVAPGAPVDLSASVRGLPPAAFRALR